MIADHSPIKSTPGLLVASRSIDTTRDFTICIEKVRTAGACSDIHPLAHECISQMTFMRFIGMTIKHRRSNFATDFATRADDRSCFDLRAIDNGRIFQQRNWPTDHSSRANGCTMGQQNRTLGCINDRSWKHARSRIHQQSMMPKSNDSCCASIIQLTGSIHQCDVSGNALLQSSKEIPWSANNLPSCDRPAHDSPRKTTGITWLFQEAFCILDQHSSHRDTIIRSHDRFSKSQSRRIIE